MNEYPDYALQSNQIVHEDNIKLFQAAATGNNKELLNLLKKQSSIK
jgi:hypothetical protein